MCRDGETQTVGVCVHVICVIGDVGARRPFDLAAPSAARAPDFSETRQLRFSLPFLSTKNRLSGRVK